MIKKELTDRFSGWLSMTASRSKITNNQLGQTFPTSYDQPIIASLVTSYRLSKRWILDAKWYFHSGRPYTPILNSIPILDENTSEILYYRPVIGNPNSVRYPVYHRLDFRVSRKTKFSHWEMESYIGLINAYNRKNINKYNYSLDFKTKSPTFQLPLFFTFGINITF